MRKSLPLLFLLTVLGWWHRGSAQPLGTVQQYYYIEKAAITFAPIVSYQLDNRWYAEGRYNYEDLNTFSLYLGRTFEKEAKFSFGITPIAGFVFGAYKGASAGANFTAKHGDFYFSSQPQYTVCFQEKADNFFYSWSNFSYQINDWLGAGVSLQHTKMYQEKALLEKGLLIEASFKNWALPLYVFNMESSDRYFLVGLNFEWEGKSKRKP